MNGNHRKGTMKGMKEKDSIAEQISSIDNTTTKREFLGSAFQQKLPSDDRFVWSDNDKKGNSSCRLKDDASVQYFDKTTAKNIECTGKEFNQRMREIYGVDSVSYKGNEPDFEPFEQTFSKEKMNDYLIEKYGKDCKKSAVNDAFGHVEVERISSDRKTTQAEATSIISEKTGVDISEIKAYMKTNGITWHECGDGKTVRAVPREINSTFSHTGGVGLDKDLHAVGTVFRNEKNEKGDQMTISGVDWVEKNINEIRSAKKTNPISRATESSNTTEEQRKKDNAISKATNEKSNSFRTKAVKENVRGNYPEKNYGKQID